jgi:hypothetical protein
MTTMKVRKPLCEINKPNIDSLNDESLTVEQFLEKQLEFLILVSNLFLFLDNYIFMNE